jgi:hypothetical protein
MRLRIAIAVLVAGITVVGAIPAGAGAEPSKLASPPPNRTSAGTCRRCHVAALPLPAQHPDVIGAGLAECAGCHASQAGEVTPHPFATRLHRAHARARLDCTTCHRYEPGRRFSSAGHEGTLGTLDARQYASVRKAMETWAGSPWLAARHGSMDLSCGACHVKELIPDDNETVVNRQCVACHGGYDTLAPLTRAKLVSPAINPHGSHLGPEIACTVCHQGHRPSVPYCLGCHTNFAMPIPGGAGDTGPRATRGKP